MQLDICDYAGVTLTQALLSILWLTVGGKFLTRWSVTSGEGDGVVVEGRGCVGMDELVVGTSGRVGSICYT